MSALSPHELPTTLSAWAAAVRAGPLSRRLRQALEADPRPGAQALWQRHQAGRERHAKELRRLRAMMGHERALWRRGITHVGGVDEVGVGPLAGPVLAAVVVLPAGSRILGVNDSKQVPRAKREALAAAIEAEALGIGIGSCSVLEIDAWQIFRAAREAMRRAVANLDCQMGHLLSDAFRVAGAPCPQTAILDGDALSYMVAAASLVAKVRRDRIMVDLDRTYPGYGLAQHMGYGTALHLQQLQALGPTPAHRMSFAPVREAAQASDARHAGPLM